MKKKISRRKNLTDNIFVTDEGLKDLLEEQRIVQRVLGTMVLEYGYSSIYGQYETLIT